MSGKQDKRQQPGKDREEQQRPQRPGQDPIHPEPRTPSRGGERPEDGERRREETAHDDRHLRDDAF